MRLDRRFGRVDRLPVVAKPSRVIAACGADGVGGRRAALGLLDRLGARLPIIQDPSAICGQKIVSTAQGSQGVAAVIAANARSSGSIGVHSAPAVAERNAVAYIPEVAPPGLELGALLPLFEP